MELPRKPLCITLAAVLLGVAATNTPVSADPSQQSMSAVQAAIREIRDQLQARQRFEQQPRTQYMHMWTPRESPRSARTQAAAGCRKFLRRHP
jgi:hypothetical protein